MADVEIKGRISVNTGNSQKSVNEMLEKIKQTKQALKDAKVGSEEYKKAQAELDKQQKELNKTIDQNSGSFEKLKGTLGNVVPGLNAASQGAASFGKQLWLLVANPIVAIIAGIVAALALVYKAFTSTNEGADKLEQTMAGIGAAIDVLRDRVLAVAGAIAKFFSGDFKGALEDGKKAVSGIGQEIANEFAAAAQATKTMQDLADSMREISVGRAKLNRDLAEAKEIMNNADASFAERRAALNKVRAAESEQSKKELDQARAEYEQRVKLNALSDTSDEDLDREAQLKAKLYNLEESSANQLRALNRMDNNLRREEQAKADAARKARDDKEKANWDNKLKDLKARADAEKIEIEQQNQAINDLANLDLENKKRIDAENERLAQNELERASFAALITETNYNKQKALKEQEKADDQALLDFKVMLYSRQLSALQMLGNTIQQFAGKSKAAMATGILIEKAAAIGQILISGFQANAKSVAASPLTLGQPFVGIQNVMTGLQIAGTVKAASTALGQIGSGGGAGGAGSSLTQIPSPPLVPQSVNTRLDQQSIQGVGNAAAGGVNRSFVLDADIKSNSERQSRIARAARLG
jgi:chromosome segregation ATPase